jgi:hypothetical protein
MTVTQPTTGPSPDAGYQTVERTLDDTTLVAAYGEQPSIGPHEPTVGHALITMVEPHPGHERAYNRWYEDDHFISGAMVMPWMFAGRRWVATRDLQLMRFPADSTFTEPLSNGCYLGTYWITPGRLDVHKQWAFAANRRLSADDRINRDRTHVFTSFQDLAGAVYAGDDVPRVEYALMDPHPGLLLEVVDAPTAEARDALEDWLLTEYLPARVGPATPADTAMVWRTNPPDPGMKPEVRAAAEKTANAGKRLTVIWLLTADPREVWDDFVLGEDDRIAAGGHGAVSLVAPFIPSRMGTNTYDDQLR